MQQHKVELKSHIYWFQKTHFVLEQDIYDNWTMFAVEDGKFSFTIGERTGEAGFGDLVVCPPYTPFSRRTITPLSFHFIQFVWKDKKAIIESEKLIGKLTIIDRERLASDYRYMREAGIHPLEESSLRWLCHIVTDLLILVEMEQSVIYRQAALSQSSDPQMLKAKQWLIEHAYEPFMMRSLSDQLEMSPVQLTRRFRMAYHMTPSAFVSDLRLGRVCRLLEETSLSLESIAQRCGYENGYYLSRVFCKKKGISPSVYRKLYRV